MIGQKLKTAPRPGGHVFQHTGTTFELNQDIIKTNILTNFELGRDFIGAKLLTKFHDGTRNVASRVFASKCLRTDGRTYDGQRLLKTNVLSNFHDDWAKIVTSRVFTSHVIQLTGTIFELNSHIKETNVLTKFHESWAKNVTSRISHKNAPHTGGHVFSPTWIIFELVRDINNTNVLTNFHDDLAKIVTSRVFTSHVIQLTGTMFELNSYIKETNVLTNFYEHWTKNVTSRVYVFSPIWTIYELIRDIIETNVSTKNTAPRPGGHLHEDWASNVTSTVFTSFELSRGINGTNVLTKFHEDRTINVASRRVLTRQNVDDARWTTDKRRSQKRTMSTLCSGELKTHPLSHVLLATLIL
ncbi:hypothetical protein DPMN_117607 [Dreissena polymorpha]|uniref:Uncharacterized protein n=1 Tax=Dreissena polymorpha TaxID=45954 RepID=A0A9D4GF90_DREPO|nr:hypothetical protein DPMN_117607 [Dreissena polymorpha]